MVAVRYYKLTRFIPARAGNTSPSSSPPSSPSVHPRSRGEHWTPERVRGAGGGSSPLARGTLFLLAGRARDVRFIPARAGNTARGSAAGSPAPVHPRSRGEHDLPSPPPAPSVGSSPLARGTPVHPHRPRPRTAVHPRSRGEHAIPPGPDSVCAGSSPLARGTRPGSASGASSPPVHPRSRGEHVDHTRRYGVSVGSSPLARGTQQLPVRRDLDERFIPARAGNTNRRPAQPAASSVHPRSRGEHCPCRGPARRRLGSSPLARGTHPRPPAQPPRPRFIPARAGNTAYRAVCELRSSVHPRSRGEHRRLTPRPLSLRGSSPLARGTRETTTRRRRHQRFIPARAGNT